MILYLSYNRNLSLYTILFYFILFYFVILPFPFYHDNSKAFRLSVLQGLIS